MDKIMENFDNYTPMMQAYLKTKADYKDAILFYRLGDFYEMFFEDAIVASRELELVLTAKSCGTPERAPMCGVPHHAVDSYLTKLVDKGYKVAICEQVEDPKLAKGIVKREVIRVVTPGTNTKVSDDSSVFVACLIKFGDDYGVSCADVGTGEFIIRRTGNIDKVKEFILKIAPKEIVCNDNAYMEKETFVSMLSNTSVFVLPHVEDDEKKIQKALCEHFTEQSEDICPQGYELGVVSGENLLNYLFETQKNNLCHINKITYLEDDSLLKIDAFTFRNLELLVPLRRDDNKGSLFYCLDKTNTSMGRRLLRSYIRYPLMDINAINERLDAIEELNADRVLHQELKEILKGIYDIERLISRISFKSANPRDLLALKESIKDLGAVKYLLSDLKSVALCEIAEQIDPLNDLFKLIDDAIDADAPNTLHDSDIIKSGYNEDCDKLRLAAKDGRSLLNALEEKEKEKTGIKNLKVKYNRVFGYYIEVTNSAISMVPDYYIRRQTLANCERFFTEELKGLEDTILGAKEKLDRLEFSLFSEILDTLFINIGRIGQTANLIAKLDVFLSLSEVAVKNRYIRPCLNNDGVIDIIGGRHPVVELMMKDGFIENDTHLNNDDSLIYLITGPNMAGKSTYMRQCALIVLMAQMGSFVPACSANIGIVDRIFTRVGASDDLSSGQSTFMVEMNEMANILKNATKNSLIILDEIGRGTSTYDGLSIAWAVIEHIADKNKLGAKTLFATHYHELTSLENRLFGVNNYSCAVLEKDDSISFLRKITKKAADKSYGIQVASLAGVPTSVTDRAKEILSHITEEAVDIDIEKITKGIDKVKENPTVIEPERQLSFFDSNPTARGILNDISKFDINNATPLSALNFLHEIQEKYKL